MIALALDAATDILGVSLRGPDGLYTMELDAGLRHSEDLMRLADILTARAGIAPKDIALVACMKGPGSFTGLRIAMSAAKGIATSLGIPLIAEGTLDCLSDPYRLWDGIVLPLIDAKKKRFFTAVYREGERLTDYLDTGLEDLVPLLPDNQPILLTGPSANLALEDLGRLLPGKKIVLDPRYRQSASRELLERAEARLLATGTGDSLECGIRYLRKSEAELELEGRQSKVCHA